ncbi:penicillin-binding protein 1C [Pusillimonas sp.]|uniref:penicillin-binding protein 1C n=1 Tax=Pusillimonas sp. TaxID=3040095 RepID=UPI0029BAD83C|nr:penicillin-binding protein 1C [Pusillimonas sp.]MDX3895795.1 penicillin-binding protein 1C [Pusillimonas sp.]
MRRVIAAAAMMLGWMAATAAMSTSLPGFESLRRDYRASDVLVLDRSGMPLQRVRADFQGRRGDWLTLDEVSPALLQAVIESEDRRFHSHNGVDLRAVAAAAWGGVFGTGSRGASTLTMQLAGLIEGRHRRPAQGRGLLQKLDQAVYAQALERRWSKDQILEAYLNLVPFRGELVGVDALARVLFQKHASGLDARESAIAAAMLRGPNVSSGLLARRACALLQRTREKADCFDMKLFVEARLRNRASPRFDRDGLAPHFARWAVAQAKPGPGEALRTSIDGALQRQVLQIMNRRLHELAGSNVRDAAVVVLDNASGQVLAYVGSSGGWSEAAWVDHAKARRQAGSTLKPFLYQQAIEQQRLTAVSLLDDGPLNLPTGNGLYIPRNYDERFSGWVSVRTALGSSLNIPAVRALTMVTPDAFRQRLARLGLPLEHGGDYYGYSLALGSADVSLLTLTNAYRALANLGRYSAVRLDRGGAEEAARVMDAEASWIVGDILSDRQARARTFGLDSPLTTPFWTAVKTGTSKDMRDNWTIGWSDRHTVGVWAGNSSGDSMRDVSGVTGAGPIWHDIMVYLHGRQGSRQPPMPEGVRGGRVGFEDGIEPPRIDYFVGDTALAQVRRARGSQDGWQAPIRIAAPQDGTVLALDPDIPPRNQRVVFRASAAAPLSREEVGWRIDGGEAVQGQEMLWLPRPGRHRVELLGKEGEVLDSVTLTVRGAVLAAPVREGDYLDCAASTPSC